MLETHAEIGRDGSKRAESWISVNGRSAPQLADELAAAVRGRITEGSYSERDIAHIRTLGLRLGQSEMTPSERHVDMLRRLCHFWDIDVRPINITSHRRFVGPLIVGAKRMLLPMLRILLKDTIARQREFNAEVIQLMAELAAMSAANNRSSDRLDTKNVP